jgi:ElaB/YqjD/DUF883 family membrane-anchored ribosome-binding protein
MAAPFNRLESIWPQSKVASVPPPGNRKSTFSETAKSWEYSFENLLAEHPKVAIAAAAVIGIALGWLVKRK